MANRIQKAWDDIIRWKKFFENLASRGQVSSNYASSRLFKKEMVERYNELLSHKFKNLSVEERALRRFANLERGRLEREIYPNVFVRLVRNLLRLGGALVTLPIRAVIKPIRADQAERGIGMDLNRQGFGGLSSEIRSRVRQGEHAIREKVSESSSPKEIIDYDLSVLRNVSGKHRFEGFSATLTTLDGKEKRSLSVEDSAGISKEQADGLLHGRAVHIGGDKWKIPDINDADPKGNIRIREIRIADFDLEKSITSIPGVKLKEEELSEILVGLRNGKRIDLSAGLDNQQKVIQVEADPLQRGLNFFLNNKRIDIDRAFGNQVKRMTVVKDIPQPRVGRTIKF